MKPFNVLEVVLGFTLPAPVNARPSITKLFALLVTEITPLITASSLLVSVLGLTPWLTPAKVKLATSIVIFSSYTPARTIILSPSFAKAIASANVATA